MPSRVINEKGIQNGKKGKLTGKTKIMLKPDQTNHGTNFIEFHKCRLLSRISLQDKLMDIMRGVRPLPRSSRFTTVDKPAYEPPATRNPDGGDYSSITAANLGVWW
ncbi:hypothetical protein E4U58_000773 [Claviceps cyperi]|nr:hypothetical protein E4U58_000773 [Claviceps cyperi]